LLAPPPPRQGKPDSKRLSPFRSVILLTPQQGPSPSLHTDNTANISR
jgi:hypothetical protein